MSTSDTSPEPRTLGNDEIHVQYRNRQDLVRQAVDYARSRVGEPGSPDGQITLPVRSFRMIVEAFRLTYKTLGETLHQDFAAKSSPIPNSARDQGREPAPGGARAEPEVMQRFNAGKLQAIEALRQAALYSESNENAVRKGDEITIPMQAFNDISSALIESNEFMMDILREPKLLFELESGVGRMLPPFGHTDHGDQGLLGDYWNHGDWIPFD